MDHAIQDHLNDEIRREIAMRTLTALLANYRTNDLEAFVDLLVQQHEAVQTECRSADRSLMSVFYGEE